LKPFDPYLQVLKIYTHIEDFHVSRPVLTIGTFDGIHLGHRAVIGQLTRIAHEVDGESVVFTFYPHPRLVVSARESNLRLLTTLEEKKRQLERSGIEHLVVYPFTEAFARLTYEQFIADLLVGKMNIHTLVVGHDHRLGKNREGTYENIQKLATQWGFSLQKIEPFLVQGFDVSSSKIRNVLLAGDVVRANQFLGYTFTLQGTVTEGNRIGRSIGFPTANIVAGDPHKLIPAEGVYAITAFLGDRFFKGMLNIGFRPTLHANADHRTIEAHLFDFDEDIYHKEITLCFHQRIRDEKKFENIGALQQQLIADREQVQKILSGLTPEP